MTKPLKILLAVISIPVVLLLAALIALPLLFDPNDYAGQIERQAQQQTGRPLKLGHLELKVFPWLAVRAEKVRLGNPAGFDDAAFAEIGDARVGVHLLPLLLERKMEVSTITLTDVVLNLHRLADGRENWSQWSVESAPAGKTDAAADPQASAVRIQDVDIDGIELNNLSLRYVDEAAQQQYSLDTLNLAVSELRYGEPFDIHLDLAAVSQSPAANADIVLDGKVKLWDVEARRYAVDELVLTVKGAGQKILQGEDATVDATLRTQIAADLAGPITLSGYTLEITGGNAQQKLAATLTGNLAFDLQTQILDLRALNLNGALTSVEAPEGSPAREMAGTLTTDLQFDVAGRLLQLPGLKATFKVNQAQQQAEGTLTAGIRFDLEKQTLDVRALSLDGVLSGGDVPGGKQPLRLATSLAVDLDNDTLHLQNARAELAGLKIETDLQGTAVRSDAPVLAGPVKIEPFNPRDLMKLLGIEPPKTADANVLKQLSLSAQLEGGPKSASLSNLQLKLDQTQMRGSLKILDFESQAIRFALNVDQLDMDRYLPPEETPAAAGKEKAPAGQKKDKADVNDIELPSEALDALNAEGSLNVGLLKINGLKLTQAQVKLAGDKGQIKTQDIAAKLYGGDIRLSHRYTPGKKPQYSAKTQIAALQALPFLQDFIGKDWVSGLANITLDVSGAGLKVGDLRRSLNGDVGFRIENGAVNGFNLGEILRKGQAALRGNLNYKEDAPKQTDFTAIAGSAQIINGVLKSDSLDAASPLFRLLGSGEINLVNETISYLAKPTVVASSKGQGGKGLEELKGLMIPIRLSGNLFDPSYKVDWKEALKQEAVTKLIPQEKQEELKQELNDKLGRELNRLFRIKQPQPAPPVTSAPSPEPVTPAPAEAPAAAAP